MPSPPPRPLTPFSFEEITRGVRVVVGSESRSLRTFCSGVAKKIDSRVGGDFLTRAIVHLAPERPSLRPVLPAGQRLRACGYRCRSARQYRPGGRESAPRA